MAGKLEQIIVVDVESTCWEDRPPEHEASEIIEIGICIVDVQRCEHIAQDSLLVRPTRSRVSPFCTQLTTLTQAQVDHGVPFADACQALQQRYRTRQWTWASYGDYDRRQFEWQCQREDVAYPFGPTHFNVKNLFALMSRLEYEGSLGQALDSYGLRYEGTPHHGVDDAWNIAGLRWVFSGFMRVYHSSLPPLSSTASMLAILLTGQTTICPPGGKCGVRFQHSGLWSMMRSPVDESYTRKRKTDCRVYGQGLASG